MGTRQKARYLPGKTHSNLSDYLEDSWILPGLKLGKHHLRDAMLSPGIPSPPGVILMPPGFLQDANMVAPMYCQGDSMVAAQ